MSPSSVLAVVVLTATSGGSSPQSASDPERFPTDGIPPPGHVRVETRDARVPLEAFTRVSVSNRDKPEYPGQLSALEIEAPADLSLPCTEDVPVFVLSSRRTEQGRFGANLVLLLVDPPPGRRDAITYNLPTVFAQGEGLTRYMSSELAPQARAELRDRLLQRWMSVDRQRARAYVGIVWYGKGERRFYPVEIAHHCPAR